MIKRFLEKYLVLHYKLSPQPEDRADRILTAFRACLYLGVALLVIVSLRFVYMQFVGATALYDTWFYMLLIPAIFLIMLGCAIRWLLDEYVKAGTD